MKPENLVLLAGLGGLVYVISQRKRPKRNPRTIVYRDGDPEKGEIGLKLKS